MERVIYRSSGGGKKHVRIGTYRKWLFRAAAGLRFVGRWSWIAVILLVVYILGPAVLEELRYAFLRTPTGQVVEKVKNTDLSLHIGEVVARNADWIVPDLHYSIYIPKIAAKSRVIEGVDPWNAASYSAALKQGVAEASGLAHPGQAGTTYLFAHSVGSRADFSRYNAIFYLLHKLEVGDRIEVVYKGELYRYHATQKLILEATDLHFFDPNYDRQRLVLQTCYPPGTSWKRLVIVAEPVLAEK